ncbi:MAG: TetR/AcrR family transcriptional regulator [Hyphomicrobiaceae bacterium]|nr:TetR/AcrR family transcriptional regulator [Hyphomicrobiaceae bacterium]
MGRRSSHSPEELRQLILQSAREIVQKSGTNALSARAIAKNIGYSPGTLYNVFKNLDELQMTIQGSLLEEALSELRSLPERMPSDARLRALCDGYIDFALRNKQLWNLLLLPEHRNSGATTIDDNFNGIIALLESAIKSAMPHAREPEVKDYAQALWASIHGISEIAVAGRFSSIPPEAAKRCVSILVDCFQFKLAR